MKACTVCDETKPLDHFYRNAGMRDGRLNQCKRCFLAWSRSHYKKKARDPEQAEVLRRQARRRRERWQPDAIKVRARKAVERAVIAGRLVRPIECERCGAEPAPQSNGTSSIEAHHDDYDKPLEVRWLCTTCHGVEHRRYA